MSVGRAPAMLGYANKHMVKSALMPSQMGISRSVQQWRQRSGASSLTETNLLFNPKFEMFPLSRLLIFVVFEDDHMD